MLSVQSLCLYFYDYYYLDDTAVEEITFMLPCTNAMEMFASFFSEVISVTNFFHKYDASFHSKPR